MPGVDTDGAGDSVTNVQLRGLPSSMTGVTLDGDSLPGANASGGAGSSRPVTFEGLSLPGIASIELSKTTPANVDADSPAGASHNRTQHAFPRSGRNPTGSVTGSPHRLARVVLGKIVPVPVEA